MADHIGITLRADLKFSTCSTVQLVHRELVFLSSHSSSLLSVLLPALVLTMQALFRNLGDEFVDAVEIS